MGLWDRLAAANAARRADWEWVKAERAARQAALSGHGGRPTMTRPTAPQPPQSPAASAQDYQSGEADPFPTLVSPVATARRKWPWFVGGAVLLLLIIGVANVGYKSSTPTLAASPLQEQALPVSAQVTLPADLVGKNARLADDELRLLGIVNIRYVSQDAEYKGVVFLEEWTVTKVEPALGAVVSIDDTVVVTATRKAGSIPQQPASPPAPAALGPAAPAGQQLAPAPPPEGRVEMPIEQTNMGPQLPAPLPPASQPVPQRPVEPQRDKDSSAGTVYYKNCGQARAAGAAPIKRGEPGYRPELDRNNDGIACDK
jgi:hypothetical protein